MTSVTIEALFTVDGAVEIDGHAAIGWKVQRYRHRVGGGTYETIGRVVEVVNSVTFRVRLDVEPDGRVPLGDRYRIIR